MTSGQTWQPELGSVSQQSPDASVFLMKKNPSKKVQSFSLCLPFLFCLWLTNLKWKKQYYLLRLRINILFLYSQNPKQLLQHHKIVSHPLTFLCSKLACSQPIVTGCLDGQLPAQMPRNGTLRQKASCEHRVAQVLAGKNKIIGQNPTSPIHFERNWPKRIGGFDLSFTS